MISRPIWVRREVYGRPSTLGTDMIETLDQNLQWYDWDAKLAIDTDMTEMPPIFFIVILKRVAVSSVQNRKARTNLFWATH